MQKQFSLPALYWYYAVGFGGAMWLACTLTHHAHHWLFYALEGLIFAITATLLEKRRCRKSAL